MARKTKEDEEVWVLTPWGCLSATLNDYGISYEHITGKMGEHLVEDFMALMVRSGYIAEKEEEEETDE